VFKEWVSWKNWVVWLNDGCWNLRWWIYSETELWFLSIIDWESLEQERSESRSGSTSDWVED
jgi:hypothetical protein